MITIQFIAGQHHLGGPSLNQNEVVNEAARRRFVLLHSIRR